MNICPAINPKVIEPTTTIKDRVDPITRILRGTFPAVVAGAVAVVVVVPPGRRLLGIIRVKGMIRVCVFFFLILFNGFVLELIKVCVFM